MFIFFQSGKYKCGGVDAVNGYQEGMNQATHVVKQLDMVSLKDHTSGLSESNFDHTYR